MTTPEALNALADRVEREEPSYALDCKIEHLCEPERAKHIGNARPYTTSLDAALTLVPEGMMVENWSEMRDAGPLTGMWLAQLCPRGPRRRLAEISAAALRAVCDADPCTHAKTPALALCAAALRARAAMTVSHQNPVPCEPKASHLQSPTRQRSGTPNNDPLTLSLD
tara:strand:- start:13708 stop:14211 length:504 start_codon:yes stop_codon:yes gene_type:complete